MLFIQDRFLTYGKRSRSNDDRVSTHFIGQHTAARALKLVGFCDNQLFSFLSLGACTVAKVASEFTLAALEFVVTQISFHDGAIN